MLWGVFVGPDTKLAEAGRKSQIPSASLSLLAGLGRYQPGKLQLLSSQMAAFTGKSQERWEHRGNLVSFITLGNCRRQI